MKVKIDNYTFNKTAKTITFDDYITIRLDSVLLITNATDSTIIFNFADPTKGGTVLNNVLTLTYDTSLMDDGDKLLIYYDDTTKSGLLGYRKSDDTVHPLRLDQATNSLQIIDYAHHEIHAGSHFFVSGVATLPINDVLDFVWVMPNTAKWVHWLWKIGSSVEMAWYVYENAIVNNALANVITPFNNNRNSLAISGTTMRFEVQADLAAANVDTDVTTAILLKSGIIGAGKSSGSENRESELNLKQGATYCLRVVAAAAGYIDFRLYSGLLDLFRRNRCRQ